MKVGSEMEDRNKKIEGFEKWAVESMIDTLKRAKEIENDPKKMKAIRKLFPEYYKEEKKEITSLDELRALINEEGAE